jgi:AraC-like DNA-binding protein
MPQNMFLGKRNIKDMKIYIKNMACIRCQMAVKYELEKLGLHHKKLELGETEIMEDLSEELRDNLSNALKNIGLELIDDKKTILVEKVKITIIELIYNSDNQIKTNLSDYLKEKLNHNYTSISSLFSEIKGTTIEKFYMTQKVGRVKELLVYEKLNLAEIAFKLNYSSVAHLSNQFKKITGLTPSHFRNLSLNKRIA